MPAKLPRSVMPRAGRPRMAARANNSSTWEAPRRKEKFCVVWSTVYMRALSVWLDVRGRVGAFLLVRGSMNREALEARKAHEEDWGTVDGEEVAKRVIGLAIKVHRTVGPGLLENVYGDCLGF